MEIDSSGHGSAETTRPLHSRTPAQHPRQIASLQRTEYQT